VVGQEVYPVIKLTQKKSKKHDGSQEYRLTSRILKDSSKRKEVLKYVEDLRDAGREIGERIKQKGLENKVTSAIAIGSLLISVLFMSNNLTGNAIAVNGTTTNITGAILFIIGLVASLIYFKRR
jgi:hypothetical protein